MVRAYNEDAGHKITLEDIYIGTHWKETYRKTKDKMERSGGTGLGEKRPELDIEIFYTGCSEIPITNF